MRVRLDRIATFFKGEQVNGDSLSPEFDYPFLNGGINPSGNWKTSNCPANTITVSEGGNSCGYVNFMEEPFWCGAHCYFLADVKGLPKYVYYALKSQQLRLMAQRTGACMPNIKKKDLGAFEFEYNANTDEQKRIAAELDKIVAMKKNAEERLEKLNLLIKARFNEMFGKDKNFPIVKLGELVDLVSGTSYSKEDVTKSGVRIMRGGNVHADGTITKEDDDVFVSIKYKDIKKSPRSGDIVIVASTGSAAVIGRAGMPNGDMPDSQIGAFLRIVRPRDKNIAAYLRSIFLSEVYKRHIEKSVKGTNIKNIKASYILDFRIALPPISVQRTFATFVEEVESLKSIAKREAEKLDLLYRSKLQEYFG